MAGQRGIGLSAVAVIALMGVAAGARAEEVISLEIPAQPLKDALNVFSQQTRTNFLFRDADFVASQRSVAVSGAVTKQQGLTQLLRGTGVAFEFLNERTVLVRQEREIPVNGIRKITRPRKAPQTEPSEIEEVTVMGTQLYGFKPEALPTSFYSRVEIERSGAGSLADFSNSLIENFPLITAETFLNNGRRTQATANQGRGNAYTFFSLPTLTLLDGQRLPTAGSAGGSFVDVSGIPLSAVAGVTVLQSGVSAIYGSDAVGGAANISLRDDLAGAETIMRYGHTARGGASQRTISQLFGGSWGERRVMVAIEHDHQLPLEAGQRPASVPTKPSAFLVFPEQRSTGAVATLRQRLNDLTDLRANLVYSHRSFSQSSSSVIEVLSRAFETYAEGDVDQVHGAVSLAREFAGDWRATLFGNYGAHTEKVTNTSRAIGSTVETADELDTQSRIASADLHLQSPDFSIGERDIKGMIGIAARQETFDDDSRSRNVSNRLSRDVKSIFTELSVPLINKAEDESRRKRLDLSLAARFDHYRGANPRTRVHSFDPKIGIVWSPRDELRLRGTWGTSFSAPTLTHMSEARNSAVQIPLPDPNAPGGTSVSLLLSGGKDSLKPEKSESYTLGLDWTPVPVPGLQFALTYFSIDFADQIGRPLQSASPADALVKFSPDEPFITAAPSASTVHELYKRYGVIDHTNTGESGVAVIVDNRFTNLSSVNVEGFELGGQYSFDVDRSQITLDFKGSYLFGVHFKASPSTDTVDLVDTDFNPVDFRAWARVAWEHGPINGLLRFNYIDSYQSISAATPHKVSDWFTADAQIAYQSVDTGLVLSFNVRNMADKPPPWLSVSSLGYDPTHASILGRTTSLQINKRW